MTTDTTALQERIARVIYGEDPKWGYTQAGDHHGVAWETLPEPIQHDMLGMAADVLPIIAAEVQAAKIKAWQEGVNFALPNAETTWYPQHNPYRTTEHETGDQA